MTNKLQGKVALITGASAGFGHACACALAGEGARLVLTASRQEYLDVLKKALAKSREQRVPDSEIAAISVPSFYAIEARHRRLSHASYQSSG